MKNILKSTLFILAVLQTTFTKGQQSLDGMIDQEIGSLVGKYKMLHAAPELSACEEKTSAFLANELRLLGYSVTDHVGKYDRPGLIGYGVVAVIY